MRSIRSSRRGISGLTLALLLLGFASIVIAFLIAPAYLGAVAAITGGVALALFGRGNPILAVIGGIVAVGGLVLAIVTALGIHL